MSVTAAPGRRTVCNVLFGAMAMATAVGQPPLARIAQGQSIQAWFVFEVPQNSVPDGILVNTGDSETPQFINWVNP